ncbi:MAG: SDR family oxidoreductase [Moraxellaceae bacterium]|nr:MAG: SDR family oxidoreductase [Moraxellaceae bacterium]
MSIVVTGATGKLGHLVIEALLKRTSANNIVVIVRNADKAAALAALGIEVRLANYDDRDNLYSALVGAEKLLLISSSEVGKRAAQHFNVIEAAQQAGVKHVVYTSLLHADHSPLALAEEHLLTEQTLFKSGLTYTILRNGWYTENYTSGLKAALNQNVIIGAADEGQISSASRQDYAEAAAIVLTTFAHENKVYELAGDKAYTLTELACEASRQTGQNIVYFNMTEHDYREKLINMGTEPAVANLLANSDAGAASGALFDDSGCLKQLLGRDTTPLSDCVRQGLL